MAQKQMIIPLTFKVNLAFESRHILNLLMNEAIQPFSGLS
jgi:hypothetical protein